jgi:hypothetical protein
MKKSEKLIYSLEILKEVLQNQLKEGREYGQKTNADCEAGWYIGTIKTAIEEIDRITKITK